MSASSVSFLPITTNILYGKTWSLNFDWKVPMNERWGFQGECFMGDNLGQFLGGIGQGYNFTLQESIYDQGGWIEVYRYLTEKCHTHIGYTLDDPLDSDITAVAGRTYNQVYLRKRHLRRNQAIPGGPRSRLMAHAVQG